MTSVLLSETDSRLGRAVEKLLMARGISMQGDTASALIITDLGPALMVRGPGYVGLSEDRHLQIAALLAAAKASGARVVLVSGLQPLPGTPAMTVAEQDARRIEAAVVAQTASKSVILRASDVMDPTDPDLAALIGALIDASPTALWPASDQVQVIALTDLAAAAVAAVQARGIEGKWFDIVHPAAASREAVMGEAGRIARLLVDPDETEVQCRPSYPPVTARRIASAGIEALHVRPQVSVFGLLAQAIQGMITDSIRNGTLPPIRPPMPAVYRALETGALPLAGCCAVVAGATGQIGGAVARMLVRLGADVIGIAHGADAGAAMERKFAEEHAFLGRQQARLDAARAREDGNPISIGTIGRFRFVAADLADRHTLAAVAARLAIEVPPVNILVNAAGEVTRDRRQTAQGVEAILALHMLAPVALTRLLAEPLCKAGEAWVINLVSDDLASDPYDLGDLQSHEMYEPIKVLSRAQNGLVALTGALAAQMTGTGVKIAVVALPQIRTPFRLSLEDPVTGDATAQQTAQTQRDQHREQMETPDHAAGLLIEVMLAEEFGWVHGCLIQENVAPTPLSDAMHDGNRLAALWSASAALSGLPE